jgi:hypothetical protein
MGIRDGGELWRKDDDVRPPLAVVDNDYWPVQ